MLKEFSGLDRHSRWSETKKKLESDARYKAIESSSRREDWFRDYTKRLDDVSTQRGSRNEGAVFITLVKVSTSPRHIDCWTD